MRAVTYTLTLHEPLLATSLQGDPNSSVSLPYVPGSLVRGALIQHYIQKHQLQGKLLEPTNEKAHRLFINGSTRFLHAYPLAKEGMQRTLPTPQSVLRRKRDELDATDPTSSIDFLDASNPDYTIHKRLRFEQDDTLKPIGQPFCAMAGENIYTYRPDRSIAVHIQRNPVKGRSLRTVGGGTAAQQAPDGAVFRYDALAPEQQFAGVVLADTDDDAAEIEALLKELGTCWLGRSRSAHYGKTTIGDVKTGETKRECNAQESSAPALEAGDDRIHSITFLSDALLRDRDGQAVADLDNATLAAYLDLPEDAVKIHALHSFSEASESGGFNRYWQLPLKQEYAVAAGSVISFTLTQPLSTNQTTALEQCGIGTRRAEGFGRIAFNWRRSLEGRMFAGTIASFAHAAKQEVTTSHSVTLAQRMARQLYTRSVEQSIVDFVKNNPIDNPPENSQLGRLRTLVRQALPTADAEYVRTHFVAFKPTARRQYERARIGYDTFEEWIDMLLSDPEQVWNQLYDFRPPPIAGQEAQRDAPRVALQLLAAVLAAPARDERLQEAR